MHIISFTQRISISRGFLLEPGMYLADNLNAGAWLGKNSTVATIHGSPALDPWTPQARRICVVRPGGLGDLVMLTPIFREMVRRNPEARVSVCTYPWNAPVLRGLPYVHEILNYPLPQARFRDFDAIVALEDVLETGPEPAETHALAAFLRRVPGLAITEAQPDYCLPAEERAAVVRKWPRPKPRSAEGLIVGIQLYSSAKNRTYHRNPELLEKLIERGHGVRVFGEPGRKNVEHPWGAQLHDLASGTVGPAAPDIRESIALAADCDVLIAPDSAFVHVAGALGLPCVALYGSFEAKTRVAYYPSVHALQGRRPCAPCCWHSRTGHWPAEGECKKTDYCTALHEIEPKRVVAVAERMGKTERGREGEKERRGRTRDSETLNR